MARINELKARVEELETDLRRRDETIKELREEAGRVGELLNRMRDQVEDSDSLIESWIEFFEMELVEDSMWRFDESKSRLLDNYCSLSEDHQKLIRDWNRFTSEYNATIAPRGIGRPLQASDAQVEAARKLRKSGVSLRAIAAEAGLGLRTVRTIVETDAGTGRSGTRINLLRRREFDRLRAAEYRARKRGRDELPKRISRTLKQGEILIKAAKGLGG